MDKSNPENSSPSFYKICLDESSSNLRLPHAFVKKLKLEGRFPQNPVLLKIQTGQKWRVEIERSGERAFFGKGWLDFAKDTTILFGDFLVFRLIKNSYFQVYIFSPNGSLKDLSSTSPTTCKGSCSCSRSRIADDNSRNAIKIEEEEGEGEGEGEGEDNGNINAEEHDDNHEVNDKDHIELQRFECKGKSINSCFQKVLTEFNTHYLELPMKFVLEIGLRNSRNTILRNTAGREWPVTVKTRNNRRRYRAYISRGWVDFKRVNKLMDGDTCSFRYFHGDQVSQSDFIQVEVVKKAARKRERPPQTRLGKSSRSRITDADVKNVIKLEEEDDDGDTNVEELDGHEVDDVNDIELRPFEKKNRSIKPCFQKILTKTNARYVELPGWFVHQSGLRNKGETTLRNKAGRYWPVALKTWNGRVFISRGWACFRTVNKLMKGDTYSIKYFHGDEASQSGFIQVEVVKKAARNRGRPPQIRLGKR